jgi:peptidyl-prolyl cis-trans isomerase B (cyclophilin B)
VSALRSAAAITLVGASLASLTGIMACGGKDLAKEGSVASSEAAEAVEFRWPAEPSHIVTLEIENYGDVEIGLYDQMAPKTVAHFLALVDSGFYDNTEFHRVIKDFMIQGGSRHTKTLAEGEELPEFDTLRVEDEYNDATQLRGVVSMANRGTPGSADTQFFIVQADSQHLNGRYTTFGRVLNGIKFVDAIAATETDLHGRWGKKNTPLDPVILGKAKVDETTEVAEVAEAGAEDQPGTEVAVTSGG